MRWFTPTTQQLVLLHQYRDRLLEDIDRLKERQNAYRRCYRRNKVLEVRELQEVKEIEKRMDDFNHLVAAVLGVPVYSTLDACLPLSNRVRMWYTKIFSMYVDAIRPKLD
jgi:hypothetical protein